MPNGKYLPADNPLRVERDLTIAQMRLQGKSQPEIANTTGVSKARVHQILSNDKIRTLINKAQRIIASHSVPISKRLLTMAYDNEDKVLSHKAMQDVLKITGILPSHAQSVFINNLLVQQNNVLDPATAGLLARALGIDDVIEVSQDESD